MKRMDSMCIMTIMHAQAKASFNILTIESNKRYTIIFVKITHLKSKANWLKIRTKTNFQCAIKKTKVKKF